MRVEPKWLPPRLRPFWQANTLALIRALIVGEAEGERHIGKVAVACVLRTRVLEPAWWGDTWQECALQPHQFSCFWSDLHKREAPMLRALSSPSRFSDTQAAAVDVVEMCPDPTMDATHYFNPRIVLPSWAREMRHTVTIGNHAFYRGF